MITIYDSKETNFEHNGLGVLNPNLCLIREYLNGEYSLSLKHPIDRNGKWELLEQDRIIKANGQLFRIYKLTKSVLDNEIEIEALHIFYDLSKNFIEDTNIENKTGKQALSQILSRTLFETQFTSDSNITKVNSARLVRKNVTASLIGDDENSFLNYWGGELKRDNFHFEINTKIGNNNGMKISYGKNLTGLKAVFDMSNVATRIVPIAFDGITLPEVFIDSPNIDIYSQPIVREVRFEDVKYANSPNNTNEEGYETEAQVHTELRRRVALMFENDKIDIPLSNFEVDFIELSKTEQYKHYRVLETVELGDVINIHHKLLNIDIDARVISYEFNCLTNRYDSIELGSFQSNIFTGITELVKKEQIDSTIITDMINVSLKDVIEQSSSMIQNGLGGYVVKTRDELLIMDTDDINTAQNIWRWNINGLGFSSTGYNGTYALAMTHDGKIVANAITAGELDGEIIKANSIKTNQLTVEAQQKIENAQSEEQVRTLIEVGLGSYDSVITEKIETKIEEELRDTDTILGNYYTKEETDSHISQNAHQIMTSVKQEINGISVGSRNLILSSNVEVPIISTNNVYTNSYDWKLSNETPLISKTSTNDETFIVQVWYESVRPQRPFSRVIFGDFNNNSNAALSIDEFIISQFDNTTFKAVGRITVETNEVLGNNYLMFLQCFGGEDCNATVKRIMLEHGNVASQYVEAIEDVINDYTDKIDENLQTIVNTNQEIQNQISNILSDNFISDSERSNLVLIKKEIESQYRNIILEVTSYGENDYFSSFVTTLTEKYNTMIVDLNSIVNGNSSTGRTNIQEELAQYYDAYHTLLYVISQYLKAQYEMMSTEIIQTKNSIDMVVVKVDNELMERQKHMKFSEDGLELFTTINDQVGKFKMLLTENRLSFFESENEVAYMSNEKLYISRAEVTTSLQIGDVIGRKSANNGFVFHEI